MSRPASADPVDTPSADVEGTSVATTTFVERLGHRFADPGLLAEALTHRSWCAEFEGRSNERLEFLGDAVLGLAVATRLFGEHPDLPEGELAKIRSSVVSAGALADVGRRIGLGDVLRLGRGEAASGGADKESILSDAMEAVIGAVFLDGGEASAFRLVDDLFADALDRAAEEPGLHDHKTRLQELVARHFPEQPAYRLHAEGPDHDKRFHAVVEVDGRTWGPGTGTSKKRAEQDAARLAWVDLCHLDDLAVTHEPYTGSDDPVTTPTTETVVLADTGSPR